jgi:hypothetical protein
VNVRRRTKGERGPRLGFADDYLWLCFRLTLDRVGTAANVGRVWTWCRKACLVAASVTADIAEVNHRPALIARA